ncbi:GIY-YIG nuclease family protein [Streptomyces decoyicus]|uniref:GIY-YIG nuclease family protein n=1 Tax=Streptomyces decoyicus TaxID=249567 RepID=UPI00380F4D01
MHVYVIGAPGSLTAKIGVTTDLRRRLREIQNLSPVRLEVLWSCPGGLALEKALHAHFAEARSHGEWFVFESDPVTTVRQAIEGSLAEVEEAPHRPAKAGFRTPPQLDLERTVHELLWQVYSDTRFTAIDAADRLGYTLPTLLGYLDALAGKGRARLRLPVRSDRAKQVFTVRAMP